jgi:hypothetical protein
MTHSRLERRFIRRHPPGDGAVEAIGQISGVINQINDISNTIASAVEEQTATTSEIARNVAKAARGGAQVAENITAVTEAARSTASKAMQSQAAAGRLVGWFERTESRDRERSCTLHRAHAAKAERPPARTAARAEP